MLQAWRKLRPTVTAGEGASDEEDFAGFNIRNKDTVRKMVSLYEELNPLKPECEVSQVDLEMWTDAGKGTADVDSINAFLSPDSESKILDNESSNEEIATEKISWAKPSDTYSTLLKFAKSRPCYLAQEVRQLHILHSTFLPNRKEGTKQADIRQMLQTTCKSHADLRSYLEVRQQ
jgi:hypothetical protein